MTCKLSSVHACTHTLSSLNRPQSLRKAFPPSAEPNVSHLLMEQITGRHAVLSQGYLHVKFSNIRVKCPGLLLSLFGDGTFKDPVKKARHP